MGLARFVDGARPPKRRAPYLRPHARTLLRVKHRGGGISTRLVGRLLVVVLVLLSGAVYVLLFWSRQFRVEQVSIMGAQRVDSAAIQAAVAPLLEGLRWWVVPSDALLAAPSGAIEDKVEQEFGAVADASVRKELPNILEVVIRERSPLAIWSAAGQFFLVDERGIAFDEIQRSESRDVSLPVIVDERHRATQEGDRVLTEATLRFVREAFTGITREAEIGINFFVAPSRLAPDLTLVTNDGWEVLFDTTQPALVQIATLAEVLTSQVKDRRGLEYIDLRIPGRVFVR
ncbi:MAG: FtsQ-type POTRA domain-containing protein [Parcubacteria group bacterium]